MHLTRCASISTRLQIIRLLVIFIFPLAFFPGSSQAGSIDLKPLQGKIFFVGQRSATAFKSTGFARQLHVINANGTSQQLLLPSLTQLWELNYYSQTKKLSFKSNSANKEQNGHFILDLKEPWDADQLQSRLSRALPDNFSVKQVGNISFSPDGSLVAVGVFHPIIVDLKAGTAKEIGGIILPSGGGVAQWSPDGSKIVYQACMYNEQLSNAYELFIADRDGKWVEQLTNLPKANSWTDTILSRSLKGTEPKNKEKHATSGPRWSPDGQWIAFVSFGDLYKVRPDGTDLTLIVKEAAYPAWSPDGNMIAYYARRYDSDPLTKEEAGKDAGIRPNNIYISMADGTNETRLTNNRERISLSDLYWIK